MAYYDGGRLLDQKDLNGNIPEIFICTSNRNAGKTTYFASKLVKQYKKKGVKFMLVFRYKYELDGAAEKFFKDIQPLFFPDDQMSSKIRNKGVFAELLFNDKPCGAAVSLNTAEQIKKISHLFNDIDVMFFDEFMPESNIYLPDEVGKLMSIHTSVARGHGKQVRYVPVWMCGNPYTILNPYYTALGITGRLRKDTKFLRGDGWVMEQGFNESAAEAQKGSAFMRAFSGEKYAAYAAEGVYLADNESFIEKPEGVGKYLATIRYENGEYALRQFPELGIIYCDDHADRSFPLRIAVTTEDHAINYVMLHMNDIFISNMRFYFEHGAFRFKDLRCKNAVIQMLSY